MTAAVLAAPAQAETVAVTGGRAGDVAIALARQTGTSIVIAERTIAERRVPAIRGDLSPREAIERLARAAGARAVTAGPRSWRLVAAAAPLRRATPAPPRPAPAPAPAPEAPPPETRGPDILVVGSKRDARLSEFAGQVSIVDGDTLAFGGLGGTEKIVQRVPTVTSTYLGSGRNKLFIRGIADSSFTGPTQSTVGQYLGDLRLSYNAPDPDLRLADLARVEILEGPQGTLYGAGSLGGIVRLVPNDPETGLVAASGMVGGSATQHGAAGGDASLTANLPLAGDSAALRVTVNAETQGGYIDKPVLGRDDVNRTDIYGARAAARFEAGAWTIDVIGIGQHTKGHDSQYADRDGPPLSRAAAVPEGHEATYLQGQVVVTGWLGPVRFKSSTGITGQDLEERYDATVPDGTPRVFVQANNTDMIANETRIWQPLGDRFGWLAGISYTHNRTRLTRTLGAPLQPAAVAGVTNVIDEFTGFAEASLRLAEGLTATAGGRFTHSRLGGEPEGPALVFVPGVPAETGTTLPASVTASAIRAITMTRTEQVFLPSASLAASVLPGTTLYVRYQEGFRPGGLSIAGFGLNRFRNDRIATMELGGRTHSGPIELAASLSYTRWNDIQADFIDTSGLPSTANIGDGRIWSGTLTASAEVSPSLRIDAGITYNDSRIVQPSPVLLQSAAILLGVPTFIGRFQDLPVQLLDRITKVPNVADLSGRVGFDYRRRLGGELELTAQGWASYVGSSRLGIGPELGEEQGDYLDSGLTVRVGRDSFGVTLGVSNLTDEEGNRFALGTPFAIGRSQITPLRPRTVRLGIDAAF